VDKIEIPTIHQHFLKALYLKDMPSANLQGVWAEIPDLAVLDIENIDDFTQEAFTTVFSKLATYQGLEHLGLSLVVFDLDANKEAILNVLRVHSDTLRSISFSKNKVTNGFLDFICEGLAEVSNIQEINLLHLKDLRSVDWVLALRAIAKLAQRPG